MDFQDYLNVFRILYISTNFDFQFGQLLTFFSVADVFALSVRFTGIDVVTKHELNLSVINDFSFNRSSTIFLWLDWIVAFVLT